MKKFAKFALGAAMLAGAATMVAAPAQARVSVGIAIGGPGYSGYGYGPSYAPRYSCDPYSRYFDPYYCGRWAPSYRYQPSFYLNYRDGWRGGNNWRGNDRDWDRGRGWNDRGNDRNRGHR